MQAGEGDPFPHVEAGEGGIDLAELKRFCRKMLAGYLSPRRVHLWPGRMPTTGNGKIDIKAVAAALIQADAAQ